MIGFHAARGADRAALDRLSAAFEHSITWEDDLWQADPVDVEAMHAQARRKFTDLLDDHRRGPRHRTQERILLFHGQSGAGKTHLFRALRTTAHRSGKAYFGYAQMTPDVANYADYYLRRLVHSLEKPYDPDRSGESALSRLTNRLMDDAAVVADKDLEKLREAKLDDAQARQAGAEARRPDRRAPEVRRARASTSTSCARCCICSAATRASTSACASTSTAAS